MFTKQILHTSLVVAAAAIAGIITTITLVNTTLDAPNDGRPASNSQSEDYFLRGALNDNSDGKEVKEGEKPYLCGSSILDKNNKFIQEYQMPITCSQPVGIATSNDGKIWVAATWTGYIVVFDPNEKQFVEFIRIPNWYSQGSFGSIVWGMKFDKNGDLWFTDQLSNAIWRYFTDEKRFEMYRTPTRNSYPSEIDFDSQGRVWFSEIFGKKLGVIDPKVAEHNTTKGVTEYELKNVDFETMGPLKSSSNYDDTIWFTTVNFPEGGQVVRFDTNKTEFTVYDLPEGAGVPVGVAEDNRGKLWINDHATNIFFMFDPITGEFKEYSTSLPTSRNDTTTLPYYNIIRDGKVWFNEHEGNSIAYFDMNDSVLVEYQIPSRGEAWGNTSNPLKFAIDDKGSVWFTEWSENRIGVLDSDKLTVLPLWLTVSKDTVTLDSKTLKGDELEIVVYPNSTDLGGIVKMTAASTVSFTGRLWNMTGEFSEETFTLDNDPRKVVLSLTPSAELLPGNYTLTVGARYGEITYNRIVDLVVR